MNETGCTSGPGKGHWRGKFTALSEKGHGNMPENIWKYRRKKTMGIRKKIMRCIINNWNPTRKKHFSKPNGF